MKKLAIAFIGLAFISAVEALDRKPWFGDVYEFELDASFAYSFYSTINHATVQPHGVSRSYVPLVGIGFVPSENISLDMDIEFARTPIQNFSFRSFAAQGRLLLLDDIAGDPLSWTVGVDMRGVSGKSVRDVNSPYASYFNAQVSSAIGKEISSGDTWVFRSYLWGALGLANHGAPWVNAYFAMEGNLQDTHRFTLFSDGCFGLGHRCEVNIFDFHGWGPYRHLSVDIGARYQYVFSLWGALGLRYAYRVYARTYPERLQLFEFSYTLPFSLF